MTAGTARHSRSPPGTWRLLAPALLGWAAAAGAVSFPGAGRWIAFVAATCCGAAILLARFGGRSGVWGRRALSYAAVSCAVLLVLGVRVDAEERVRADPVLSAAASEGRTLELDLVLDGYPEAARGSDLEPGARAERASVRALAAGVGGRVPLLLWLSGENAAEYSAWGPGTRIRVSGTPVALQQPRGEAFGVRVAREAEAGSRREPGAGSLPEPGPGPGAPPGAFVDWQEGIASAAAGLRSGLRDAAAVVPGAELVPGMAVGDTSLVDERLETDLRDSSLLHLLAVSGANCALITGALIWAAARCGAGRRTRLVLAGTGLAAFVVVVGPDASVRRAAVMACVMLASGYGGKRAVALPSLAVAMLVLLIQDPWQATHAGFALSVSATAGILLLVPAITEAIRRTIRAPAWLALPFAVALAAQLACGPLLLLLQPALPAGGIIANVLAGPAAPLGTGLGLAAMLVLPFWAAGGTAVLVLARIPAGWVAASARVASELPLARWPWPQGWQGAALLAGIELAILGAWALRTGCIGSGTRSVGVTGPGGSVTEPHPAGPNAGREPGVRLGGRRPWSAPVPLPARIRIGVSVLLCGALGALLGPTVVAPTVTRVGTPDDWVVVACDVGQGDALLLRDPADRSRTMLVDTGDDPAGLEACLDRFEVRSIALLVLTHDDRDHVGALDVVTGRVDEALIAPDNLEDGARRPVVDRLRGAGIPFQVAESGMTGALSDAGLNWRVLAPEPGAEPPDTNAASVVMRVEAGGASVLLLADTGAEEHTQLLRQASPNAPSPLHVDVLKVAHHGSRDADPELFTAAGASYGLVSVGADNGYGHPAADTLSALERAGTLPLRTDRLGSIALSLGGPENGDRGSGDRGSGTSHSAPLRVWTERADASPAPAAAHTPAAGVRRAGSAYHARRCRCTPASMYTGVGARR